ncbi:MAG: glycosyltransferase family 4 protein [Candidatus Omnitrophica bacterium]|nr:glycosyltransferase family 4 protein [Candidatus Omnitrophota bacterium]
MNILLIANHLNPGGITSYLITLGKGLVKEGHRVYLATAGGTRLARCIAEGMECIPVPMKTKNEFSPAVFVSAVKLGMILHEHPVDVIHAHSRTTQVLGCLLGRWKNIPVISTCHGFFNSRRLSRRLMPCWGMKVIAVSEQVKRHLEDDFGVAAERIAVVHNGIDFSCLRSRERGAEVARIKKSLGLRGDVPAAGIIARLSDVKGHRYLIEAMREVKQRFPGVQLLVAGDGKMRAELVELRARLRLEGTVVFVPEVRDIPAVLSAIDIFVMPSLQEGLGLALMEAMAAGCAVVASNVGGIRTLVTDGETGLLAEPGSPESIARSLLRLLGDAGLRERLGARAQEYIRAHFSQEKMVRETEEVYRRCLY